LLSKRTRVGIDPAKLFEQRSEPRKGAKVITKKTKKLLNIPGMQTRSAMKQPLKHLMKTRKVMADDTGTETILNDSKEVLLRMFECANLPAALPTPATAGVCRVLIGEVMNNSAMSSQTA
jgi:hypothetical protein